MSKPLWQQTRDKVNDPNYGRNNEYEKHVNKLVDIQHGYIDKYIPGVEYLAEYEPRRAHYNNRWLSAGYTQQARNDATAARSQLSDTLLDLDITNAAYDQINKELNEERDAHQATVETLSHRGEEWRKNKEDQLSAADKKHQDDIKDTLDRAEAAEKVVQVLNSEKLVNDVILKNKNKKNMLIIATPKDNPKTVKNKRGHDVQYTKRETTWVASNKKELANSPLFKVSNLRQSVPGKLADPYDSKHVIGLISRNDLPAHDIHIVDEAQARALLAGKKARGIIQ